MERRLVNIAPGIDDNDAATVGQLQNSEDKLHGQIARVRDGIKQARESFRKQRETMRERQRAFHAKQAAAKAAHSARTPAAHIHAAPAAVRSVAVKAPSHAARRLTPAQEESRGLADDRQQSNGGGSGGGTQSRGNAFVSNQIASLSNQVAARFADVDRRLDRNASGVAMAMALTGSALPANKKAAIAVNYGTFEGQSAVALSSYLRVDDSTVVSGGVSYGVDQNLVGGRFGMQWAW
jgi:hypothetical protein